MPLYSQVRATFERFDTSRTGSMRRRDFKRAVRQLGFLMPEWQIDTLMDRCDRDKDGRISFDEFTRWLFGEESAAAAAASGAHPAKPRAAKSGELGYRPLSPLSSPARRARQRERATLESTARATAGRGSGVALSGRRDSVSCVCVCLVSLSAAREPR